MFFSIKFKKNKKLIIMRNEKGQFVRKDDEDKEYHYPKFSLFYKIIMFIFLVLLALPWLPFVFKGIKNSLMAFEKISVCMENPQEIINQACLKTKSNKMKLNFRNKTGKSKISTNTDF